MMLGEKKVKSQARDHSAPSLLITRTAPAQIKKSRAKRFPSSQHQHQHRHRHQNQQGNRIHTRSTPFLPSFLPSFLTARFSLPLSPPLASHTEAPSTGHLLHLDSFLQLPSTTLISDHQVHPSTCILLPLFSWHSRPPFIAASITSGAFSRPHCHHEV
ncbi:hypothetical protein BDP81DRAFT_423794 [Colletotrichum phormii]|uniref:Uncharacterized protein n=1 Tax=Colletotrichum phormii TaxID=359342 RepID=A0AAI9ZWP0_9PEZI|nr:uncharacterized protein BDP81DRAFT_423794 [Colletotrichum phormii]KAK1639261.1 hypothetical protein BDP81DRAFT_423794 [Colletotrichum phormii]